MDRERESHLKQAGLRVEHVVASLNHMGGECWRVMGLAPAELQLTLKSTCYNLRRLIRLKTTGVVAA